MREPTGTGSLSRAVNNFGVLRGTRVDLSTGSTEQTGNPFDFAIEGDAFFAVESAKQTLYTRNGNFHRSSNGQLVTAQGDPVLGEQGAILVPSGQVSVGPDGTISVDGATTGKLKLAQFAPGADLEAVGTSYYAARGATAMAATGSSIRQGMLEGSNANPISAVVGMITVQRQAEMLQRALTTFHSEFNRIASTELSRV
jgi:flagellar basal-body rod protein FlgF/flagellar basal-body rod protein FlgG